MFGCSFMYLFCVNSRTCGTAFHIRIMQKLCQDDYIQICSRLDPVSQKILTHRLILFALFLDFTLSVSYLMTLSKSYYFVCIFPPFFFLLIWCVILCRLVSMHILLHHIIQKMMSRSKYRGSIRNNLSTPQRQGKVCVYFILDTFFGYVVVVEQG